MQPNKKDVSTTTYQTILARRSIRRFQQTPISLDNLKKMVNAARLAPSAANLQPLEYIIVNDKTLCARIFETIGWAAYLTPKWTPNESERPVAYIVLLVNDTTNKYYQRDTGLATENIVLTAEEQHIGSCILLNINREKIREILQIPKHLDVDSAIALGFKAEHPVVEELTDSVKYWRDPDGVLHVPKRKLEDIIHVNSYL